MNNYRKISYWMFLGLTVLVRGALAQEAKPLKKIDPNGGPKSLNPSKSNPKESKYQVPLPGKEGAAIQNQSPLTVVLPERPTEIVQGDIRTLKVSPRQVQKQAISPGADESGQQIYVRIAAGSEKYEWMDWAAKKWAAANKNRINGKEISIIIEKAGSIKSANFIRDGNRGQPYTVWSPASSLFRKFVEDAYSGNVFETDQALVLSPLVFATFSDSREGIQTQFRNKDDSPKPMSMSLISEVYARELTRGPQVNENHDAFKFAMTNPLNSNSGTMGLLLMAFEFFGATNPNYRQISLQDVNDTDFQKFVGVFKAVLDTSETSTGNLGNKLASRLRVLDSALIYENMAIQAIRKLERMGTDHQLVLNYPGMNMVTDHPYYVLKQNTSNEQRQAATMFMEFLQAKEQQLEAMQSYGFRPVSEHISDKELDTYFGKFAKKNGFVSNLKTVSRIIGSQPSVMIEALMTMFEGIEFTRKQ